MDIEKECVAAFYSADKSKALHYLGQCHNPSKIRTKSPATLNGILFVWNISLLHIAAKNNWPDITCKLIREYNCEPESVNNRNSTPLHYAARFGSLETLKLFIEEFSCDPLRLTTNKWNALHWAASKGQVKILRYLIEVVSCNASLTDIKGHTLLHLACAGNHTDTIMYLLKTGLIDPLITDIWECTPSQWGKNMSTVKDATPKAVKVLDYFEKCRLNAPVDTYTQVFVFGDKGAGKSSLVKVLKERSKGTHFEIDNEGNIKNVQLHTIGIIPENIQSNEIGNMIVYDLAGDAEYHYSHASVMENAVKAGLAMFILIIDISQNMAFITKQIYYWFNFVSVLCNSTKLNVLIIGSHSDLISDDACDHKHAVIKELLSKHYPQSNTTFIPMDCRKVESLEISQVSRNLLLTSLPLLAKSINIDYTCHALYLFLKHNTNNEIYCRLSDLSTKIIESGWHDNFYLPSDESNLVKLLQILSKKGLILFLYRQFDIENSWVIIDIGYFLHEINGLLFSPDRHDLSSVSNIGVIPINWIKKCFPNQCPHLLSDVFVTLGVCQKITNKDKNNSESFFFPSFITSNTPSRSLPLQFDFVWILKCKYHFNFFSVQFCHMLLAGLALTFPLKSIAGLGSSVFSLPEVSRRCQIWKFGIHWKTDDFIENVVQISDDMQQVKFSTKAMIPENISSKEMLLIRSAIIKEILSLLNDCCSSLEVIEMVELSCDYYDHDSGNTVDSVQSTYSHFAMEDIIRTICLKKRGVLDLMGTRCVRVRELIYNEPFAEIPQEILLKIFKDADTVITLLQKDQINVSFKTRIFTLKESITFGKLKSRIEPLSIFNGRTTIIQKMIENFMTDILDSIEETTHYESYSLVKISGITFHSDNLPDGPLKSSHLPSICRFLKHFNKWFELGLVLGLKYTTLKEIENSFPHDESRCKVELLVKWLDVQSDSPPTKLTIMDALQAI